MSAWFCSTIEGITVHPDQDAAEKAAARFKGPAVAWQWDPRTPEAAVSVPVGDSSGGVASGSTETQNAAHSVAKAVERAMEHLGLRTGMETT